MKKWLFPILFVLALAACSDNAEPSGPLTPEIPTVEVTTVNGEALVCDYVRPPEGCMGLSIKNANKPGARMTIRQNGQTLYDSGDYEEDLSGTTIRIRGNTSAWRDKKGYKINLQEPADLLFRGYEKMYRDKEWLLINDERGALNTLIGHKVNELIGMPWAPRFKFVNLVLNGEPQGLYILIESVKRNKRCRVDVSKTGYIVEYDPYWWNEDVWVETPATKSSDAKYTFKYPDSKEIQPGSIDYIRDYIGGFDEGLLIWNHYSEYIDTLSFASWLLAHDILGNYDAHGSNIYMTKYDDTPASKLKMGPLWDFDAIMQTPGKWSNSHRLSYFIRLMSNGTDRSFANAYRQRWEEVKDTLFVALRDYLEAFANSEEGEALDRAIAADNQLWNRSTPTLRQSTDQAIAWFEERRLWLDAAISEEVGTPSP